jgi:hypothetical protein
MKRHAGTCDQDAAPAGSRSIWILAVRTLQNPIRGRAGRRRVGASSPRREERCSFFDERAPKNYFGLTCASGEGRAGNANIPAFVAVSVVARI